MGIRLDSQHCNQQPILPNLKRNLKIWCNHKGKILAIDGFMSLWSNNQIKTQKLLVQHQNILINDPFLGPLIPVYNRPPYTLWKVYVVLPKRQFKREKNVRQKNRKNAKRIAKKKSPALFSYRGKLKKEIYKKAKFEHNDKSNGVWHKWSKA